MTSLGEPNAGLLPKSSLIPNTDVIPLSVKFGCSSHNIPLMTYEIQTVLTVLSVTAMNLHYYLCPVISHIVSNSFPCSV